jgi:hypothetical protein
MSEIGESFQTAAKTETDTHSLKPVSGNLTKHKITRDCPRVTVRFSREDYQRLQELADGVALSVYLRAKALEETLPKRRRLSSSSIEDNQAIARLLGLLGQSRIANNLNQLAYHANIGTLQIDDETKSQIIETYDHVLFIRRTLMKALCKKSV